MFKLLFNPPGDQVHVAISPVWIESTSLFMLMLALVPPQSETQIMGSPVGGGTGSPESPPLL